MKKFNKGISTMLGLAMVFSLTACGNSQTGTTETTQTSTTEPAAETADAATETTTEQAGGEEIHISYSY